MSIAFNKTYFAKNQIKFIKQAFKNASLLINNEFIKKCELFLQQKFKFKKVLLTSSCTDALEMCALLLDINKGDEVIIPSYTFVSSANAFALRGAKIVFADSNSEHPNITSSEIKKLITKKTKAIVVVHYAGMSSDIDAIKKVADEHDIFLIEDAAQCINSYFKNKALGSFGHLSTLSFHYTKNVSCGEGGALIINDKRFLRRAEILVEKGTNRMQFLNGEVMKYEWVDLGSSFGISDFSASILYSQLLEIDTIHLKRKKLWTIYEQRLAQLQYSSFFKLPVVDKFSQHNYNCFYLICKNKIEREKLSNYLKSKSIQTSFHYLPLHSSPYTLAQNIKQSNKIVNATIFSDCLLRLPLYPSLTLKEVNVICDEIKNYFSKDLYR